MKKLTHACIFVSALFLTLAACNDPFTGDEVPVVFEKIQLNADEVYIYAGGASEGVRLDPLLNDSIKVPVIVSYSTPQSGTIQFITHEGWFYKANEGFIGTDTFTYTVCYQGTCSTAPITLHVEKPLQGDECRYELNGESVTTKKDQPLEIRIFANDVICPYQGSSINKPEKGTFTSYAYSGNLKNIVYVYFPPKGFVGTDRFRYKIFTPAGDLEVYCNITITE
ncbi:MAG: Ig-like domain-containing protein [Bacteroidota bacterium]